MADQTPNDTVPQKLYIAVLQSLAVRDAQFCTTRNIEWDSEDWQDCRNPEIYLGTWFGTHEAVRKRAAEYGCTAPENIRLIELPDAVQLA